MSGVFSIVKHVHNIRKVRRVFRGIRKIAGHKDQIARAGASIAGAVAAAAFIKKK